jgi:hypothetical protein
MLTFLSCVADGRRLGFIIKARVAQLVEQRTENPRVTGSIPVPGTTYYSLFPVALFNPFVRKVLGIGFVHLFDVGFKPIGEETDDLGGHDRSAAFDPFVKVGNGFK